MPNFINEYTKSIEDPQYAEIGSRIAQMLEGTDQAPAPKAEASAPATGERKMPTYLPNTEGPVEQVSPEGEEDDSGFMSDVGNFLKELPMQVLGGVGDAVNNTVDAARSAGKAIGIPDYALQFTDKDGNIDLKFLSDAEVEEAGGLKPGLGFEVDKAETTGGGIVRALTQFATGFIPATAGLKAVGLGAKIGKIATGMAAGAVSDAVTSDPHQERLASLLNQVPVLGDVIPDYMADNDPNNETEWEGRMKNVIEGAALGLVSEAAVAGAVKMFKGYKLASAAKKGMVAEVGTPESVLKEADEMAAAKTMADEEMVAPVSMKDLDPEIKIDTEAVPGDVLEGAPKKSNLNTARISAEDDVLKTMDNVGAGVADTGRKTFEGIKKASKDEMTELNKLLDRPTDLPFTAEEAVASRNILTASGENLTGLAKLAASADGSPAALYNFRKALAIHEDIQTKVFAGRKATAQSLASWRITAESDAVRGKMINDLMGGSVGKDALSMAKALSDVAENGGNISKAAAQLVKPSWQDAYYQVWINGLLSSPATHGANIVSNMGTTLMSIPERYMTAAFETMTGINGAAFTEANARATGFASGLIDGFQLMTGKSKQTAIGGVKTEARMDAISSAAWNKQPDSMVGKGLDYLGKATGLPGWALEKGDMFFKGVNYRMMLNEKATKTALEEGLTGKEFATRVADLVSNPTEAINDVATDFARYQTFTNKTGETTQAISKAIKATPMAKYIMPFINTPSNILKYSFERTPLALGSSTIRAELKAGGSRAAEITARIAGGSMLMAGASSLAMDGRITGAGPSNYKERQALEAGGWAPYSVKIGNKYISYQRLEPIGSLIGYSADVTSIMGQMGEDDAGQLVSAGMASMAKNLTSKTYLSGLSEFMSVVASGDAARWENYTSRFAAGMVQPLYSSAAKKVGNYFDDVKRDYKADSENGYLKSIFLRAQENIPGLGTDAPVLRDMWGEEHHYSNGVAPIVTAMSPIAISKDKEDPINDIISSNQIAVSPPRRKIMGVELSNKEYSEYTRLAGEYSRQLMEEAYESGTFEGLTDGPEGEQALIVRRILTQARKAAKSEMFLESPDLEDRFYANKLEEQKKLTGE
jgi:hypothetical protein